MEEKLTTFLHHYSCEKIVTAWSWTNRLSGLNCKNNLLTLTVYKVFFFYLRDVFLSQSKDPVIKFKSYTYCFLSFWRPCAMVVPDFELICEIMLVAEGFQDAKILARKFITLYTLCKELLSKQDHYDWGLRAIKSVLVVAGSLKVCLKFQVFKLIYFIL